MISSWSSTRPADVTAQILTCRDWQQPATDVLYRRVDLEALRHSRKFLRTIQSAAHLRGHVKALHHCPASLVEHSRFATVLCDIVKLLWNLDTFFFLAPPTAPFGWNIEYVRTLMEFFPQGLETLYFCVNSYLFDSPRATDQRVPGVP